MPRFGRRRRSLANQVLVLSGSRRAAGAMHQLANPVDVERLLSIAEPGVSRSLFPDDSEIYGVVVVVVVDEPGGGFGTTTVAGVG